MILHISSQGHAADGFMFIESLGTHALLPETYGVEYKYKHAKVVGRIIGWRLKLASSWTSVGEVGST